VETIHPEIALYPGFAAFALHLFYHKISPAIGAIG